MYLIEPIRNNKYLADGAVVLALQVYVQENLKLDDDILFPFVVNPNVQIGVFQNTQEEVNADYIEKNNILVVRRDTGGGAIYLDQGCIGICYLIKKSDAFFANFAQAYQPAIKILKELGVEQIQYSGKNDLTINNKKVSGQAMKIVNDKIYGGYSLLLDVDYEAMDLALKPNQAKISSKAVASVKSHVTALRPYLKPEYQNLTSIEFKNLFCAKLLNLNDLSEAKRYHLTDHDWAQIDQMLVEKYKNWEWVYGNNPKYTYNQSRYFTNVGTIDVSLEIDQQRIVKCKIYGDFFAKKPIAELEKQLVGTKLVKQDLLTLLEKIDFSSYFNNLDLNLFVDFLINQNTF